MRCCAREVVGERAGAVGRVVVDDDQLAVDARGGVRARRRVDEIGQPIALVVGGNDDRERGRRRRERRPRMRLASTIIQSLRALMHHPPVLALAGVLLAAAPARRSCSRWAPIRGSTPTSASASCAGELPVPRRLGSEAAGDPLTPTPSCAPSGRATRAVGGADLLAAAAVAWLLFRLGGALGSPATGAAARARSSCCCRTRRSPGSAASGCARSARRSSRVAVTAAFLLLARTPRRGRTRAAAVWRRRPVRRRVRVQVQRRGLRRGGRRRAVAVAAADAGGRRCASPAGSALPVALMLAVFAAGGALRDLYDATIAYNVQYSGETYAGPGATSLRYLLTFPIERARVDALWTSAAPAASCCSPLSLRRRERLVAVVWVAAACLSIADQRQPRPAAVLRPGQPGAGARGRLGRRSRRGRWLRAGPAGARRRSAWPRLLVVVDRRRGA